MYGFLLIFVVLAIIYLIYRYHKCLLEWTRIGNHMVMASYNEFSIGFVGLPMLPTKC